MLQAFTDFIESWEMWYDVASIGELKDDATAEKKKEHKAKVFRMCAFTGERLKTDLKAEYNQNMAKIKAADFDKMVNKLHIDRCILIDSSLLKTRYSCTINFINSNRILVRKLVLFINKVCQHADKCAFKCTNTSCTEKTQIHKTLIREQIIIGTTIASIRENTLEKEHDLTLLISAARKIEATNEATKLIDPATPSSSFPINYVENEEPPNTPVNKIGKREANTPRKTKEGRISRIILKLPRVQTRSCVALAAAEAIVTGAQTVQLNTLVVMHVEKRDIFLLSASK